MFPNILKSDAVKTEILNRIETANLKEGDPVCREKDLMALCEVSRITVRSAISQLSREGKVFSVKGKGLYVGNFTDYAHPRNTKIKSIELITPIFHGEDQKEHWGAFSVVAEMEKFIRHDAGYKISLSFTHGDVRAERRVLENAVSDANSAIIFEPSFTSTQNILKKEIQILSKSGKPFIVSERFVPLEVNNVYEDDSHGAWLATSHLIRNGHSSILHMNFAGDYLENRRKGYKKALIENNIPVREGLIYERDLDVKDDKYVLKYEDFFELGYQAVKETMGKEKFTAIFAISDMAALGAIKALEEIGLKVPQDVSVVGYDNRAVAEKSNLTSIERPFSEMGRVIAETIVGKIREKDLSSVTRIGVKPRLVERGSVRMVRR
ncbi:MAG: GntR family transcriptional regulator [Victivallales bacterium]